MKPGKKTKPRSKKSGGPETRTTGKTSIWLHGASGRMGLEIQDAIGRRRDEFMLMGGSGKTFLGDTLLTGKPVDPEKLAHAISHGVDVVIDFSLPEGNAVLRKALAKVPVDRRPQVLIGTTGLSNRDLKEWVSVASQFRGGCVFVAPNTSRGVLATIEGALRIQQVLGNSGTDITIVETHHRMKKDAPSGTAKMFASRLDEARPASHVPVTVTSVRGGGIFGEHEIRFMGLHDEIVVTHRAYSRGLFAEGALDLATWLHQNGHQFKSRVISLSDYSGSLVP